MKQPIVVERLSRIRQQADERLGRIDRLLPQPPHENVVAYLAEAQVARQHSRAFAEAFDKALAEYQAVQRGMSHERG